MIKKNRVMIYLIEIHMISSITKILILWTVKTK